MVAALSWAAPPGCAPWRSCRSRSLFGMAARHTNRNVLPSYREIADIDYLFDYLVGAAGKAGAFASFLIGW